MKQESDMRYNSLLIHGGIDGDRHTGAVNVPVYQTSTYRQPELGRHTGYEYSRTGNPTREALEKLVAELEGGRFGLAFASGMAATTAVLNLFQSGDEILLSSNVYGGTFRVIDKVFSGFGLTYEMVNTEDIAAFEAAITPQVKAVLIESPANPLMTVTDIAAIAQAAHKHGLLVIVDNTFMTPYLQRPLTLGADIVVHSGTKYLGGHSDLVAGIAVTDDEALAERLYFIQNATGGILQPWDSFLLVRGIKTLSVRMDRHGQNAAAVVEWLVESPAVKKVYYPGLPDSQGYEVHRRQALGAGGMLSFELEEGYDYRRFLNSLRLITLAESLGGVESLVCHPASMTHASIPPEIRERVGIGDGLVRLSVGIEDSADIVEDLRQAIARSAGE